MAPHSSTLAWKIPWAKKPGSPWGRKESDRTERLHFSLSTFMHWRRKWQPTPVFLPGESQGQWAPVYGVAQSRTRLKRLSSSSSSDVPLSFRYLVIFTSSSSSVCLPRFLSTTFINQRKTVKSLWLSKQMKLLVKHM